MSEWTNDYSGREDGIEVDPAAVSAEAAAASGVRVFRGGGFWLGADGARAACRNWVRSVHVTLGFRVVVPPRLRPRALDRRS